MDPVTIKILQTVLLGLNVYEAAQPYIDKIVAMNEAGATGEEILAACELMRKTSGDKLDADLARGT